MCIKMKAGVLWWDVHQSAKFGWNGFGLTPLQHRPSDMVSVMFCLCYYVRLVHLVLLLSRCTIVTACLLLIMPKVCCCSALYACFLRYDVLIVMHPSCIFTYLNSILMLHLSKLQGSCSQGVYIHSFNRQLCVRGWAVSVTAQMHLIISGHNCMSIGYIMQAVSSTTQS